MAGEVHSGVPMASSGPQEGAVLPHPQPPRQHQENRGAGGKRERLRAPELMEPDPVQGRVLVLNHFPDIAQQPRLQGFGADFILGGSKIAADGTAWKESYDQPR